MPITGNKSGRAGETSEQARQRKLLRDFLAGGVTDPAGGAPTAFTAGQEQDAFNKFEASGSSRQAREDFFLGLDIDNPLFDAFASSRTARNTRRRLGQRRGFASTILTGLGTGLPGAIDPSGDISEINLENLKPPTPPSQPSSGGGGGPSRADREQAARDEGTLADFDQRQGEGIDFFNLSPDETAARRRRQRREDAQAGG